LLTSAGTWFLAPLLRARRAEAQNRFPRRLVLFFNGNSHPEEFFPTGTGAEFRLTEPMSAFAGLEKHMLFLRPIHGTATFDNHHTAGPMNLFTGAGFAPFGGGTWPTSPSIDHLVAPQIAGGAPRKHYHINMQEERRSDGRGFISYSGPGQPVAGERDPARIAEAIFGVKAPAASPAATMPAAAPAPVSTPAGDSGAAGTAAIKAKVRSEILRINTEELREIQRYLGREEKAKLELHVTALQDIGRIAGTPPSPAAPMNPAGSPVPAPVVPAPTAIAPYMGGKCVPPAINPGSPAANNADAMSKAIQSYFDILVAAFMCDQLRVAAVQVRGSGDDYRGFLGFTGSWHDNVAHRARVPEPREWFKKHLAFFAGRLAYFAHRLDSIKEGDGTMLDNTIIVWGVESGINHNHTPRNMPYLVMGGRGMGLKTGQFLQFAASEPCTKLLTGVCNGLGVPIKGIGTEPASGPLAGMF
jgi:hypothetical protein